ncbi:MAG: APC family permease [Anaerolineaceae bacterium]|nr:APC family permease [Anaerolineaceae bacterium]
MFKSYLDPEERQSADRQVGRLMFEGLLLGGTGLGVLALIFEIAADAFSVAAYQTLLAIHGAEGHHEIAIAAFIVLSIFLFLGIVPAYKAGAYLRPNAGGSGPLVEAIGPPKMRWLSWIGTSLFFLDAVLTIIISSISAADVTMLILPELAQYRILLAEVYAFFIMVVLVALGPKRAVPLFLIGGGAFTIFTIVALSTVSAAAIGNPEWSFLTDGIVNRLEAAGVVEHVVRAQQDLQALTPTVIFQLFFRSMSSAMLGFSGYEVIPASGKHAAKPKWKVINTALTLAAIFLIGTGVFQLFAAQRWQIPATEGYSTLLIEYEIIAAQTFGTGITPDDIVVTDADRNAAINRIEIMSAEAAEQTLELGGDHTADDYENMTEEQLIEEIAHDIAFSRMLTAASGVTGQSFLAIAGVLLAIILLLAQGGGYVGGAAVAANAARLGRLPGFFIDDRIGIAVIWGVAFIFIPIIREVVIVESYYAFGFVSAFIITSTTVFFVREDVLIERGIQPGSGEARSLKFAGLRGMVASYIMGIVLVTQKTDALMFIILAGAVITLLQFYIANGGLQRDVKKRAMPTVRPGAWHHSYASGVQRAFDQARQRGVANLVSELIEDGALVKFNVEPDRIIRLVSYTHGVDPSLFHFTDSDHDHDHIEEPSVQLEEVYQEAHATRNELIRHIERYSHYGIFTFIDKYHKNWLNPAKGRDEATVQRAMLGILFPMSDPDTIWQEFQTYRWEKIPEAIWQFCRERYRWAKDQWPNLSDRITTVWVLQDYGLIPDEVDVDMQIIVDDRHTDIKTVHIHTQGSSEGAANSSERSDEQMDNPEEASDDINED